MERALRFHSSSDCHRTPSYKCLMSDKPGLRPQQAVGQALRDVARHILADGRTAVEDKKRASAVSRYATLPRTSARITGGRAVSFRTTGGRPAPRTPTSCAGAW